MLSITLSRSLPLSLSLELVSTYPLSNFSEAVQEISLALLKRA